MTRRRFLLDLTAAAAGAAAAALWASRREKADGPPDRPPDRVVMGEMVAPQTPIPPPGEPAPPLCTPTPDATPVELPVPGRVKM